MNTDPPFEGDVPPDGEEPSYEWLDEWLCEYVDGTMDPSLEAVFEQYVEANPELKAHVERLQETRDLLCSCGLPEKSAPDVEDEVCEEVQSDLLRSSSSVSESARNRPIAAFGVVSSVAAALVIGFLVGAMAVQPSSPLSETPAADRATQVESGAPFVRRTQPTTEHARSLLDRSSVPLVAPDSGASPASITRIGVP